jgi:hypothetical protein
VETNRDTTSADFVKNADTTMKADKKGNDLTIPAEATNPKNKSGSTSSKDSVNDKKGDDSTIPTEATNPKNEGSSTSSKDSVTKDVAPTKAKQGVTTTLYILPTRSLRTQKREGSRRKGGKRTRTEMGSTRH